ncbi:MAG: hypothetical protein IKR73_00940 [Oscillospiraceae bacterium]|nr:hypothetical protein [Oscillospiraceae bacterium]
MDDTVDLFHSFNQKQIDARLNDNTSSIRELGQLLESYKLQLRSIMEHPTKEADTTTYSYLISIEKAIYLYCIAHMLDVCLSGNKEMIGKYSEKLDAYIRGYYDEVHDIVSKIYEGSKNYFDSRRVPGSIKKDHYHPDKDYQEYLNAFDQSTYIRYLEGSNDTYKQLTAPVKVYISQDNVYVVEDVK